MGSRLSQIMVGLVDSAVIDGKILSGWLREQVDYWMTVLELNVGGWVGTLLSTRARRTRV